MTAHRIETLKVLFMKTFATITLRKTESLVKKFDKVLAGTLTIQNDSKVS
jgi:hypothetical protein